MDNGQACFYFLKNIFGDARSSLKLSKSELAQDLAAPVARISAKYGLLYLSAHTRMEEER